MSRSRRRGLRPVDPKFFTSEAELADERRLAHDRIAATEAGAGRNPASGAPTPLIAVIGAWALLGIPLAWGLYRTLLGAANFSR